MSLLFKKHGAWIYLISFTYVTILNTDAERLGNEIDVGDSGLCPAENSKFPTYLRHPVDCNMFYICANGIPVLKRCEPQLHFNSKIKACDYPQNAGCKTGNEEKPNGKVIGDEDSGRCPAKNSEFPVYLGHPSDCSLFYVCSNGEPILKRCEHGLHFNPKVNACDYPENAGCETEKPKSKLVEDEDIGRCPAVNSKFPVYLHHPSNCNMFYICANGVPVLKKCEPGLHFNRKINACDYPENAGCKTEKPKGKLVDVDDSGRCPSDDYKFPVYLHHSSDCNMFYICANGISILKRCEPGLHFNRNINACDYPQNAGCETGDIDKPKGKMIDSEDSGRCPAENSEFPVFLRHPSDCSKFYICDSGIPLLNRCPLGLLFNPEINACDYRQQVGCDTSMKQIYSTGVASPYCPSRDGKIEIYFRHPTNCSVFYMCSHGLAYEFTCPARLHFNLRKRLCDYEKNSNCQNINS